MNVELLARLIDAGTPADLVAEVAAELARAEASREAVEQRRASDRERQQRRRHAMSRDITAENVTPPSLSPSFPPDPPINPIPIHPDIITRARKGPFPAPLGVTAEQWGAFVAQRKKKLTDRAYQLLCNKLEALARDGWPPGEMIDLAVERGWETVFAPTRRKGHFDERQQSTDGLGPTARAAIEAFGHPDDDWLKPVGRSGAGTGASYQS